MARFLIVCGSDEGQAQKVAEHIAITDSICKSVTGLHRGWAIMVACCHM